MPVVVKIVLLVAGLILVGMVVGYRRVPKAAAAVGAGASMLYGLVAGIRLYAEGPGHAWRLAGGALAAVGAAVGPASGRRAGFAAFGPALAAHARPCRWCRCLKPRRFVFFAVSSIGVRLRSRSVPASTLAAESAGSGRFGRLVDT
jgi:hypothetical protein